MTGRNGFDLVLVQRSRVYAQEGRLEITRVAFGAEPICRFVTRKARYNLGLVVKSLFQH